MSHTSENFTQIIHMSEWVATLMRLTVIYRSMIMIPFLSLSLVMMRIYTRCRIQSGANKSSCFLQNVRTCYLRQEWANIEIKRDRCHQILNRSLILRHSKIN